MRNPLVSLATVDAAFIGAGRSDWPWVAQRLIDLGLLAQQDLPQIDRLWWFGQLIANTDMHFGNLSFGLAARASLPGLKLAPAYDMLPMRYAPLAGGELPRLSAFTPALPLPAQRASWDSACAAGLVFWQRASQDIRISDDFRRECQANAGILQFAADRL